MNRIQATLCALFALFGATAAHAADEDNLLPVEQAFQVETKALDRSTLQFQSTAGFSWCSGLSAW